jgi:hypothetical protein
MAFMFRDCRKPQQMSLSVASTLGMNQTRHLLRTCLNCYHCTSLLLIVNSELLLIDFNTSAAASEAHAAQFDIMYAVFCEHLKRLYCQCDICFQVPFEKREFSLGITSLSNSIGIGLVLAIALPVLRVLCQLPNR